MFADQAQIEVAAGSGGDGALSFRREKYRPNGGPDGGDGGRGGNVIFLADHNQTSLAAFRTQKQVKAQPGDGGSTNRRAGRGGEDSTVKLPVGTQVFEEDVLIADLVEPGQEVIIAKGGRGGFGNAHFVSSTRQAPRAAEFGEAGEHKLLRLELKLVADVGLVGLPNAGKSTLLSVISNARPAIGDYAFTTLVPNLGVVDVDGDSMLVADIPGLIEGASEGKGLGDDFLRHIERTAVLLHLVDVTSPTLADDYRTIVAELAAYQVDLTTKPRLVVATKIEALPEAELKAASKELKKLSKLDVLAISAQAHRGLTELLRAARPLVTAAREERAAEVVEEERVVIDELSQPELWSAEPIEDGWRVRGERLEGFARRTNWDSDDGIARFRDILRKNGVARELKRQGAEPGDVIWIGDHSLEFLA